MEDKALDGAGVQIYCAIGFERAVNAEKESVMDLARAVQGKGQCEQGDVNITVSEWTARAYSFRGELGERRPDEWLVRCTICRERTGKGTRRERVRSV